MNIGLFLFQISNTLIDWAKKLYTIWNYEMSIGWIKKFFDNFGVSVELPDKIGLNWIFTSAGAAVIFVIIIYRMFK